MPRCCTRKHSLGLCGAPLLLLASCSDGILFSCHRETLDSIASPDEGHTAIVSSVDCGATTSATLEVSIVERGSSATDKGIAMVADRTPTYSEAFRPVWTSDKSVDLKVPHGARIFTAEELVGDVSVHYSYLPE